MITKIDDEVINRIISGETLLHTNEHFTAKYVFDKVEKEIVESRTMSFNNGKYNETVLDWIELRDLKVVLEDIVTGGNYNGTLEWEIKKEKNEDY